MNYSSNKDPDVFMKPEFSNENMKAYLKEKLKDTEITKKEYEIIKSIVDQLIKGEYNE
jgi:DNA-directed RNA polymerase specialized sigma54-like protein